MKPLTDTERQEWDLLKTQFVKHKEILTRAGKSLIELGAMLTQMKERKLYRAAGETFKEAVEKDLGVTHSYCCRLMKAAKIFETEKLLLDCGQSDLPLPESVHECLERAKPVSQAKGGSATLAEPVTPKLTVLPVRKDPELPVHYNKPPMNPANVMGCRSDLEESMRDLDHILNCPNLPYELMKYARDMFSRLTRLQKVLMQGEFPGMDLPATGRKDRCTLDQALAYIPTLAGLKASDAEWFFNKCEGCGWKNNGKAIIDWRSTCRAWHLIKVFPSQKTNTSNQYGNSQSGRINGVSAPNRNAGTFNERVPGRNVA